MDRLKTAIKLLFIMACFILFAAGCGAGNTADEVPPEDTTPPVPEIVRTPVTGALTLEDGRKVDGFAHGKIGDELTNVFFSFCVNKAELTEEYQGKKSDRRSYVYLVAEVTVSNAFDGPVPMWANDFIAQWGDGDGDYCYPIEHMASTQMEDEYTLAEGESVTKNLVYEVPLTEDKNEYGISYQEYFEDEVTGNLFMVKFELAAPQ